MATSKSVSGNGSHITVPAAATALGVSRIVLDRAIKKEELSVTTYHTGGKNGGFRLIDSKEFKAWLTGRKGYHEALKGGATKFHEWNAKRSPETVTAKALVITSTNKVA